MKHFEVEVIEQQEQPKGGVEIIHAASLVSHGFLPGQALVDLQQSVALARNPTHRGKRRPHNSGNGVLISWK